MNFGYYLRSTSILGGLYAILFGFIFGIAVIMNLGGVDSISAAVTTAPFAIIAIISLLFLFLQFLVSPFIMDFQLRWIYDMTWVRRDELSQGMQKAIHKAETDNNFTIGKIGIIHDGMPNAFTYGHFRNNARVVVTEGILNLLDDEEQEAVMHHEMGHIIHYDFVFMTLASSVPLLFYYFYRTARSIGEQLSRNRTSGGNNKGNPAPALYFLAGVAYIIYFLSKYIVLLLSRYREHFADHYSATKGKVPHALSSALVKIAYGLVTEENQKEQMLQDDSLSAKKRRSIKQRMGYGNAMSTMGLADVNMSKGLVMQAASGGGEVSPQTVAQAATWDLKTPWAKFIELSSTHPLTGKRLKKIDDFAEEIDMPRKYPDLGKVTPPESLWDEFIIDLFVQYFLPWFIIILPIVGYIAGVIAGNTATYLGGSFLVLAAFWYLRVHIKYPGAIERYLDPHRQPNTVVEALSSMERDGYYEASPVRGKPIMIKGRIGGRGTPGYVLSEDMMVRDETGFVVVDFSSIIPFYNLWFGWKHVKRLQGKRVRIVGWYHRSIMPRIQLFRMYILDEDNKEVKNRWRGANLFFVLFLAAIGLLLVSGILVV